MGADGEQGVEQDRERDGVRLTHLDQPLLPGDPTTKRDLVDYLDAMADLLLPVLAGRALTVVRVLPGQAPFVQKNLPRYAPSGIPTLDVPTQDGRKVVRYPVCGTRAALTWFANQRAVEYHPALFHGHAFDSPTHLVVDLDPPDAPDAFARAAAAAVLVRQVLADAGHEALVKTSGAKGVHVLVPLSEGQPAADVAAATRAVAARAERLDPALTTTAFVVAERGSKVFLDATRAGGATLVAAYSPRARPRLPVSVPLRWEDLAAVSPADLTVRTVPGLLAGADPWSILMPARQRLDAGLVEEGRTIPVARVAAMHAGRRRARERRAKEAAQEAERASGHDEQAGGGPGAGPDEGQGQG